MSTTAVRDRPAITERELAKLIAKFPPNEMPMPDALYQFIHQLNLLVALKKTYFHRHDVVVVGNVYVYYNEMDRKDVFAPDCCVVFGVDRDAVLEARSYMTWLYDDHMPDFALEIGSKSTASRDLNEKMELYRRLGIRELWYFDPSGGLHYGFCLRGYRLVGDRYEPIEMIEGEGQDVRGRSEVLFGLELRWESGELRLYDWVEGAYILTAEEEMEARLIAERERNLERTLRLVAEAAREQERDRAEAAEAARDQERARAEAAEAEIERLRRMLGDR